MATKPKSMPFVLAYNLDSKNLSAYLMFYLSEQVNPCSEFPKKQACNGTTKCANLRLS